MIDYQTQGVVVLLWARFFFFCLEEKKKRFFALVSRKYSHEKAMWWAVISHFSNLGTPTHIEYRDLTKKAKGEGCLESSKHDEWTICQRSSDNCRGSARWGVACLYLLYRAHRRNPLFKCQENGCFSRPAGCSSSRCSLLYLHEVSLEYICLLRHSYSSVL